MVAERSTLSAEKILVQLLDLGKKSKKENEQVEAFLEKLSWDSLSDALSWLFDKRNKRGANWAPDAVHYLYRGLTNESQQEKRTQTTLLILHSLRESDHLSRAARNDTLDRLALALDSASGAELAAAAQDLVDSLRRRDDQHAVWRTALPKILALVAECEQVPREGEFISGTEFRAETMTTLLDLEWSTESLASLAIMFSDMSPEPETTLSLAEKFCAALPKLAPPALVTLAQALLPLLRKHGAPALFLALARYFDKWVYGAEAQSQSEETSRWVREAPAAEATLRLCVLDAAGAGAGSLHGFLRAAGKMAACPETLLSPFLLATMLALSQLPTYQDLCLKPAVAAVVRAAEEQRLRAGSAWLRGVTSPPVQPTHVIELVVQHNHQSERVLRGVVALALRLLEKSGRRADPVCQVANAALVAVVKRRPREMATAVLAQLYDGARDSADAAQFVECVGAVVSACPESLTSSGNATRAALANVGRHALGPALVRALAPALAVSAGAGGDASAMRETLIIVLRKDLASNKLETRLNAVTSLLQLLRHLEVKDLAAISSSQCSQLLPGTSRDSQASLSQRGFSPSEATCTDLLRALARCFGQQAAVRQALYIGLGRSASRNPELLGYVHDMLLGQLSVYLSAADDDGPPLRFAECLDATGALKEPLGHLLLASAQALALGRNNGGGGKRLREALDALVVSMPRCQPEDITVGDDSDRETLGQAQDCLDALLAHVLLSPALAKRNPRTDLAPEAAAKVGALVQARQSMADFAKPGAGGKGAKGAKGRKPKAGTQADDDAKKPKKTGGSGAGKARAGVFDHAATLRLLHVSFQEDADSEPMRRSALRLCGTVAAAARVEPDAEAASFAAPAAATLWAFARTDSAVESETFAPALKHVTELAALVADRWPRELEAFLEVVGGGVEPMLEALRTRLDTEPCEEEDELALVHALAALTEYADADQSHVAQLLTWLESRLASKDATDSALPTLALVLRLRQRTRAAPALDVGTARQLLHLLGPAEYHRGGDERFPRLRLLTDVVAPAALAESCASAKETLSEATWFAERLDAELVAIAALGMPDEAETYRRERALCLHVGQLLKPAHALASARPSAKSQRALATLLTALYACATRLAKHFRARPAIDARALTAAKFDVLVKLMGGAFSETVAGFISTVQNVGPEEDGKAGKSQADNLLPGVTFQKETLERYLIQLSKTAKTDLMQFVKVNGARDFRLKKTLLMGEEAAEDADESQANTSRANKSQANTSRANKSKAETSRANTSRANTSRANTSRANTSRANTSRANTSRANTSRANTTNASRANTSKTSRDNGGSDEEDNDVVDNSRRKGGNESVSSRASNGSVQNSEAEGNGDDSSEDEGPPAKRNKNPRK